MRYGALPPVGALPLPELEWRPSPNGSSRRGRHIELVFVHRWSGGTFDNVVGWLRKRGSEASAHVVYAGELGRDAGRAAQLVPWSVKAWTECDLNALGVSVEFGDALWLGHDPRGFARAARIIAALCHYHGLGPRWVRGSAVVHGGKGFLRHLDAGRLGCGHLFCPTTDRELWAQFVERVVLEYRHGGFRPSWGRT